MTAQSNIEVLDSPLKVNYGEWGITHPECDTIHELIGTGPMIWVFAYAKNAQGNRELRKYRDIYFPGKIIMKGMTLDGIRSIT